MRRPFHIGATRLMMDSSRGESAAARKNQPFDANKYASRP
jgi:hypothetical protein